MSANPKLLYILQLAQLSAGLRRGALLSGDERAVAQAEGVFRRAGLATCRLDAPDAALAGLGGTESWLFAGVGPDQAEITRDLYLNQRRLLDAAEDHGEVTRRLGEQLGYPPCCVEAFLSLPRLGDDYLLRAAYYRTVGVVDPRCMFLGRWAPTLLQHAPCSLNCAASVAIAEGTARQLAQSDPDHLARTEALNRAPLLLLNASRYFRLDDSRPTTEGFACTGFAGAAEEWEQLDHDWRERLQDMRQLCIRGPGDMEFVDSEGVRHRLTEPDNPLRPLLIRPQAPTPFSAPLSVVVAESFPSESAQALSSFFPALYVSDLWENGIAAELWHLHRSPADAGADAETLRQFKQALSRRKASAFFWFRSFDPDAQEILLHRQPDTPRILVDTVTPNDLGGMSHRLPIVDRRRFVETVLGLGQGRPPAWLRRVPDDDTLWSEDATPTGDGLLVDPRHPYNPVVSPRRLNPRVRETRSLLEVAARPGCPYRSPCEQNPLFASLDLSGLPYRKGCSYCATRTPYFSPIAGDRMVDSWLFQVRRARTLSRAFDTVRILDQGVAGLLVPLMEALEPLKLPPLTWCVDLRVSEILDRQDALAEALAKVQKLGHGLDLFCIGFENFSDAELVRFNKGSLARDNWKAVAVVDDLARRFPDSLRHTGAASGFILFTPWTTPADLLCNAEAMESLVFGRFRSGAFRTRLRLYRDTALYELARADGLLADAWPDAQWEAGALYSPEVPWRFAHAQTARVFALLNDPGLGEGEREGAVLKAAIAIAEETPDAGQARARLREMAEMLREQGRQGGEDAERRGHSPGDGLPARSTEALERAQAERRAHPGDFDVCMALAREYVAVNRPHEALREFMAARKLNPAHPDPLLRIGELLAQTGQPDKARLLLRQSLERLHDPKVRTRVLALLKRLGEVA